ncbi:riboflavin synthase [Spirillospora albida]|uniref:riboflavin synthase n=1 Tax=Spirillospora albida TaxID=58123 RepID=UPI0004C2424E|nr:riboflavin synthase [Spirillospora albida]
MFTGIVEELGEIVAIESAGDSATLTIRGPVVTQDAVHGASIAVNGVCLTVVDVADGVFTADAIKETLDKSSLGALEPGSRVNLERPVRLSDRLGGHLVQGHVDGVGAILSREPGERWDVVTISLPPDLSRYLVDKGSITVDGISLTVVEAKDDRFSVALIPTTLALTTLGHKKAGDPVNLEVDIVGKYVERMFGDRA